MHLIGGFRTGSGEWRYLSLYYKVPLIYFINRMDRNSFWQLHDLIAGHQVFQTYRGRPQRPVHFQLAAFLSRMGALSAVKAAGFIALAEGSVYRYSQRVCKAIRSLRDQFVRWPDDTEREHFSAVFGEAGFPGCLGSADGTYIRLDSKPKKNGYAYYNRKGYYSVSQRVSSV